MLIIRGVNLFPTQIEELILKMPEFAPHYQLVITRQAHLDALEVKVELRSETWPQLSESQRKNLAKTLQHHIKSYCGVTAEVTAVAPLGIERTAVGKARRVVDQRHKT
jgi:phenylacetate-CoA ligase